MSPARTGPAAPGPRPAHGPLPAAPGPRAGHHPGTAGPGGIRVPQPGAPRREGGREGSPLGTPRRRAARAGPGAGGGKGREGKGRVTPAAAPVNWELIALNGNPGRSGTGLQMNENTAKNYLPANFPGSRACRAVKQRGVAAKPRGAASGEGLGGAACRAGGTGAVPCPSRGRDGHHGCEWTA